MARLTGLGSFALITTAVLFTLRLLHLATPIVFPSTRVGPIELTSLEDVARRVGFRPMVPAYRPASLGDRPVRIVVWLSPRPMFQVTWRSGDQFVTVTQRQGGPGPPASRGGGPLGDGPDWQWGMDDTRCHLVLGRGAFWIEVETSLSQGELRRFADTLAVF